MIPTSSFTHPRHDLILVTGDVRPNFLPRLDKLNADKSGQFRIYRYRVENLEQDFAELLAGRT